MTRRKSTRSRPEPKPSTVNPDRPPSVPTSRLPERLRSLAIGLLAALVVARLTMPETIGGESDTVRNLNWVAGIFLVPLLLIVSWVFDGRVRVRFAWADLAAYGFFGLIGLSVGRGAEGRVALNLGWEWIAVGLSYLSFRMLPRDRSEVRGLAGCIVATAIALSCYGLYQVAVIQPELRAIYLRDPAGSLQDAGVENSPIARQRFEDRLLGSREPTATYALANSLAGVLVGPIVLVCGLVLAEFADRHARPGRVGALALAALPGLAMLACFLLTKSRSGYLGLAAGLGVLAWESRRAIPKRAGIGLTIAGASVGLALILGGLATGQLDRQVLSEASKSLGVRREYWAGTWRLLMEEPGAFWNGLGPGNFGGPYLRHRLPTASEGISDPHNLFLEVWATAGVLAVGLLAVAIGLGLRESLGGSKPLADIGGSSEIIDRPPSLAIVTAGGLGGIVLAILLRPELGPFARSLNPFEGDLTRWVVLGVCWFAGAWAGAVIWGRRGFSSVDYGAAAVALAVNLSAAGGIGYAPVALGLWGWLAFGQDVRSDRACSRVRAWGGRGVAFGLLGAWSALAGVFLGTSLPAWRAESHLEKAQAALDAARAEYQKAADSFGRRPTPERLRAAFAKADPFYRRAAREYGLAAQADPRSPRPWLSRAFLELETWRMLGEPVRVDALPWHRIRSALDRAASTIGDRQSYAIQGTRARIAGDLLAKPGWPDFERQTLARDRLEALRVAARLNPTDAALIAEFSDALEWSGFDPDAREQATRALALSRGTPNRERQLTAAVADRLRARLEGENPREVRKGVP